MMPAWPAVVHRTVYCWTSCALSPSSPSSPLPSPLLPPPPSPSPSLPPSSSFMAAVSFLLQKVQDFFHLCHFICLWQELFPFKCCFLYALALGRGGGKKEISILLGPVPECSSSQGVVQELSYVRHYLWINSVNFGILILMFPPWLYRALFTSWLPAMFQMSKKSKIHRKEHLRRAWWW